MKKFLKWAGIGLLALIGIMVIYGFIGLDDVSKVKIDDVDLTDISDGDYVGSYDNFRWSNKVEVTVKDQSIAGIKPIKIQDSRDDIVKTLTEMVINQQTPNVDAVSGATASSNGFLKAIEAALKNALK